MFMTYLFSLITHFLIVVGLFAMIYFIAFMIRYEATMIEKVIRCVSAMTGFLIYFGSKALGISIPQLMMSSVAQSNPFTFGLFTLILPSAAGILVAWYCIRCIRDCQEIASRIVILIVMFIIVMFGDVYAVTFHVDTGIGDQGIALLPNLTFVVALSLYVIFKFKPKIILAKADACKVEEETQEAV